MPVYRNKVWVLLLPGLVGPSGLASSATSTGQFSVSVTLLAPAGCRFTAPAGQPATLTLNCGSNLYVNVQPTVVTSVAGPVDQATTSTASVAGFGVDPSSVAARAPSELGVSVASLADINDNRTAVGGAMFVARRTTPTAAGDTGSTLSLQLLAEPSLPGLNNPSGQPVEMWLTF